MRFVTFSDDRPARAGVMLGEADVLDLGHSDCAEALGGVTPDLLAMIEIGLEPIATRIETLRPSAAARRQLSDVSLLAPLSKPPRIVGAAHNYRCAVGERGLEPPAAPVLFEKLPSTVVGPGDPVILPANAGGVTYEAELAVVIGRRAEAATAETAMAHVAGYTLFNDVSASEVIRADGNFDRGKNFPTFGPMGPWLATPEEFDPATGARVSLSIDGTTHQDGSTADLIYGVADLIVWLSRERPLEPGTVIATGTPAGVAPVQSPPTWLRPGSVMTVAIEGLGRLSNPISREVPEHDG